jgi:hypothetical protein
MADFKFNLLTHSPDELRVISTALGATADNQFRSDTDLGKAVKMGANANHVICAAGDEIEAFIDSVKGNTVNEGYSFGGVSRGGRHAAVVGANQVAAVVPLDYGVADIQAAAGTNGEAAVKVGTPTKHLWRVVNVIGDGLPGSKVILERDE